MSSNDSVLTSSEDGRKALHACSTCRKQKKGCDKVLPSCSVCRRLQRPCVYDPIPSASGSDSLESLARRVSELENELRDHRDMCEGRVESNSSSRVPGHTNEAPFPASTAFPPVFFLDVNVFKRRRLKAPMPQMAIQDNIFKEIGNDLDIRATVGAYFFSTATWMSIVSKKQLHQEISAFPIEMAPDVVLLILCMKLVNGRPTAGVHDHRTRLYAVAKNFFLAVESSGFASIRLLQAGILLCIYETGHAIYPQAYISIGHIGRLGQAIGLHDTDGVPQLALEPGSWDEMEERRRVWWAVYVLDRHMNIGNPSRSLALAETGRKEYLPVEDKAWELGEVIVSEPLLVSSSTNITLYHHSSSTGQSEYSQNPDHDLCQFGSAGLHSLVSELDAYARHIQSILPYNIDQASPLIVNCLYRMAVWLSDLSVDITKPDYSATLNLMKATLSKLALRWRVAREYLQILEDFESASPVDGAMILDPHPMSEYPQPPNS